MKNLLVLINTMFLLLTLVFALNMYMKADELESEVKALHTIQKTQIEELEKEIRLLKTDIDIMQNGFSEKEVDN